MSSVSLPSPSSMTIVMPYAVYLSGHAGEGSLYRRVRNTSKTVLIRMGHELGRIEGVLSGTDDRAQDGDHKYSTSAYEPDMIMFRASFSRQA